jgi:hypothetical protein
LRPLPRSPFLRRVGVAVLAIVGGYFVARSLELNFPAAPPAAGGRAPGSSGGSGAGAELARIKADGDELITRVLATLERWPNVKARFRQSLRVGEELQTGLGDYWQQGVGNQRRTCWQWQTLIDGRQAVFAQVYDKDGHLWTDERFPDRRSVTRVNVAALRRDLATLAAGQGGAGRSAAELELRARGGLSQLIAELRASFTFGAPAAVVEDGKELVAIVGAWREEPLKRQWQSLSPQNPGNWPGHLPHHVVVKVGREDLFPYVIEYRRATDAALAGDGAAARDPLARFEFFEVQWGVVMPERLFEFSPTDVDWRDVTAAALERLRPAPPSAQSPPLAQREGAWRR